MPLPKDGHADTKEWAELPDPIPRLAPVDLATPCGAHGAGSNGIAGCHDGAGHEEVAEPGTIVTDQPAPQTTALTAEGQSR
jgi:hypothetical protein